MCTPRVWGRSLESFWSSWKELGVGDGNLCSSSCGVFCEWLSESRSRWKDPGPSMPSAPRNQKGTMSIETVCIGFPDLGVVFLMLTSDCF